MTMRTCLCQLLGQPCYVEWDGKRGKPLEVPIKGNNTNIKEFINSIN